MTHRTVAHLNAATASVCWISLLLTDHPQTDPLAITIGILVLANLALAAINWAAQ